jgi:hypothetical protein
MHWWHYMYIMFLCQRQCIDDIMSKWTMHWWYHTYIIFYVKANALMTLYIHYVFMSKAMHWWHYTYIMFLYQRQCIDDIIRTLGFYVIIRTLCIYAKDNALMTIYIKVLALWHCCSHRLHSNQSLTFSLCDFYVTHVHFSSSRRLNNCIALHFAHGMWWWHHPQSQPPAWTAP